MPTEGSKCQVCDTRVPTHRLHLTVMEDRPLEAPTAPPRFPDVSLDVMCCRVCAAKVGLQLVTETLGVQAAKDMN